MYENFPEVEDFAHFTIADGVLSYNEKKFREEKLYLVDTSFFDIFSFQLIVGDKTTALKKPFETILSESSARKYFGDEDPIEKSLLFNGERELNIIGVLRRPDQFPSQARDSGLLGDLCQYAAGCEYCVAMGWIL